MLALILITGIIICAYSILIISFYVGWKRIPEFISKPNSTNSFVSVIIAVRNEEENISALLKDLSKQILSSEKFEVIIINDHSTDNTKIIIENNKSANIRLLDLPENLSGKKEAISYGVSNAKGELIVTTDADCNFSENWLSSIASYYDAEKPDMIIAPVMINSEPNLFSELQALEFTSLVASSAGACGLNSPIMCNAANLAFKKELYQQLSNNVNNKYSSGDDMFLMLAAKKQKKKIEFLKSKDSVVTTIPAGNIRSFVNQRLRWASKSTGYNDFFTLFTQFIVFFNSLVFLVLVVLNSTNITLQIVLASVFIIKSIVDVLLLSSFLNFTGQKKLLKWFLPLQTFYFIYIIIIAITSQFTRFEWKERR